MQHLLSKNLHGPLPPVLLPLPSSEASGITGMSFFRSSPLRDRTRRAIIRGVVGSETWAGPTGSASSPPVSGSISLSLPSLSVALSVP